MRDNLSILFRFEYNLVHLHKSYVARHPRSTCHSASLPWRSISSAISISRQGPMLLRANYQTRAEESGTSRLKWVWPPTRVDNRDKTAISGSIPGRPQAHQLLDPKLSRPQRFLVYVNQKLSVSLNWKCSTSIPSQNEQVRRYWSEPESLLITTTISQDFRLWSSSSWLLELLNQLRCHSPRNPS
jgi:hypothetical protein